MSHQAPPNAGISFPTCVLRALTHIVPEISQYKYNERPNEICLKQSLATVGQRLTNCWENPRGVDPEDLVRAWRRLRRRERSIESARSPDKLLEIRIACKRVTQDEGIEIVKDHWRGNRCMITVPSGPDKRHCLVAREMFEETKLMVYDASDDRSLVMDAEVGWAWYRITVHATQRLPGGICEQLPNSPAYEKVVADSPLDVMTQQLQDVLQSDDDGEEDDDEDDDDRAAGAWRSGSLAAGVAAMGAAAMDVQSEASVTPASEESNRHATVEQQMAEDARLAQKMADDWRVPVDNDEAEASVASSQLLADEKWARVLQEEENAKDRSHKKGHRAGSNSVPNLPLGATAASLRKQRTKQSATQPQNRDRPRSTRQLTAAEQEYIVRFGVEWLRLASSSA